MSDTKHTPGPWLVNRRGIMAMNPDTGRFGVLVSQPNWRGIEPDDIWQDTPREANARLIAAAPDLLAALEMAQLWLDYDGRYDMQNINAAIAKAKGE